MTILAVGLAGCTSVSPVAVGALSGRLSLNVAATPQQAARQFSAGFELRGDARQGELDLTSPLGTVLARARWQPGQAQWSSAEGRFEGSDLDPLAERALGERLPLAALFEWLRGRPWPQAPHTPRPQGFEQLGWWVDLQGWPEGRMSAQRTAEPAVTVRAALESRP